MNNKARKRGVTTQNSTKRTAQGNSVFVNPPKSSADEARAVMDRNALVFVNSIFDPWTYPDARRPDLTMFPTGTQCDQFNYNLPFVNGTTGRAAIIQINAHPNDQYRALVSMTDLETAWGFGAWANSANMTDFSTRYCAMRAISMGVRVLDYGKLLDRGVVCWAGLVGSRDQPQSLSEMGATNEVKMVDVADDGELKVVWLPVSGTFTDATGDFQIFSAQWHDPISPQTEFADCDPCIWLAFTTDDQSVSDDIMLEITTNYETLPLSVYERTTERRACLGGQESIGAAWSAVAGHPEFRNAVNTVIDTGVHAHHSKSKIGAILKGGAKLAKGALSLGSKIPGSGRLAKQILTKVPYIGGMLGGLFSKEQIQAIQMLHAAGIAISCHHPFVKEFAAMDTMQRCHEIEKLVSNEKYRRELEDEVFVLHPKTLQAISKRSLCNRMVIIDQ